MEQFGRGFIDVCLQNELSNTTRSSGATRSLSEDIGDWNPFGEAASFSQLSEDNLFGAEFDKIRRGSQSSKLKAQYLASAAIGSSSI